MPSTTLVLLPGLDGTGNLFANFVSALTPSLDTRIVRYPTDRFLSYADLFSFVVDAVPQNPTVCASGRIVLNSFGGEISRNKPTSLKGLVICAGFIRNPVRGWLRHMKTLVRPSFFRIPPPRFVIEHFLIGAHAPRELRDDVRRTLRSVSPEVVALRVQAVMACDASEQFVRMRVPTRCPE